MTRHPVSGHQRFDRVGRDRDFRCWQTLFVALLLVMMLGLFGSNQVAAIGSIAVVLGGIVSLGSNVSTLRQAMPPSAPPRCSVRI